MEYRHKVLMVDDEKINREFFSVMLSKLGFVVEVAVDGIEAIEKVKEFNPDIIILDIIMPRMSGWEVTKILKADINYKDIPIIMLSFLDNAKDKVTGFELGVDDYITKPFNFSEVLARIRTTLRNRELFTQVKVRESRLELAEELNKDLKNNLSSFAKCIDELDSFIETLSKNSVTDEMARELGERTRNVRKHIAVIDARIEKTILEWDVLKKNEVDFSVLGDNIHNFLSKEQKS